jgi:hypothetical protein
MNPQSQLGHSPSLGDNVREARAIVEEIQTEAQHAVEDAVDLVSETNQFVRGQLVVRPYVTLGAAAGVGYLLGGGLPRWVARMAIAFLARTLTSTLTRRGSPQGRPPTQETTP